MEKKLPSEPFRLTHKRWRHRELGYVVEAVDVRHHSGEHGYYSIVYVRGTRSSEAKEARWPATQFVKQFKPAGRKITSVSRWDRIGGLP